MNILALSTWFPYPPDNGSKLRALYLLRALARNHSVTVVAFDPSAEAREKPRVFEWEGLRVYRVADDPFSLVGLPKIVKYASPTPLSHWPRKSMRSVVRQLAAESCWDRLVAFQMPVGGYAVQLPGVPAFLDLDVSLSFLMHERYLRQVGAVARAKAWVSWTKADRHISSVLRHFQICSVASNTEGTFTERMARNRNCRVTIVPNGVDCQRNVPGLANPKEGTLIFNGALTYGANYDAMRYFLADVYPLIKSQYSGAKLTITGSSAGVDLPGLAIDDSVRLSGYVDDIRIPVSKSAVCIVPLRQGGGTRLKILEAMALGVPVVSTTKGAEGLQVTPNEDILLADTPSDFAGQVVRLFSDRSLRQHISLNARRLVETHYDWMNIGANFCRLVEDALQGRKAPLA